MVVYTGNITKADTNFTPIGDGIFLVAKEDSKEIFKENVLPKNTEVIELL